MATHGSRQQKKLAKRKAERSQKQKLAALLSAPGLPQMALLARKGTITKTAVSVELWERGIGYAWISRTLVDGRVVFANFMLDVWCLGVKDVIFDVRTAGKAQEIYRNLEHELAWRAIAPADLRELVHQSVAYAKAYGFASHPDYRHAQVILEGIEGEARETFTFGKDGQPFFVSGPYDSLEKSRIISEKVSAAGGHYFVGVPKEFLDDAGVLIDEEQWDDVAEATEVIEDSQAVDPRCLSA
jgi:hypothetical protein